MGDMPAMLGLYKWKRILDLAGFVGGVLTAVFGDVLTATDVGADVLTVHTYIHTYMCVRARVFIFMCEHLVYILGYICVCVCASACVHIYV